MNFLNNLVEFISSALLKIVAKLPASPFDFSPYLSSIRSFLGYVNYFVPFYLLAPLLTAWVAAMEAVYAVILVYRFIINRAK